MKIRYLVPTSTQYRKGTLIFILYPNTYDVFGTFGIFVYYNLFIHILDKSLNVYCINYLINVRKTIPIILCYYYQLFDCKNYIKP